MMTASNFGILIVDDEPSIRAGLAKGLRSDADYLETAGTAAEALEKFRAGQFALVIADIRLPGSMDGLQLLEQVLRLEAGTTSRTKTTAIIITAYGAVETAVRAMRLGAYDFIVKPLDLDVIRHQVRKVRDLHELRLENESLRHRLARAGETPSILGSSPAILEVFEQIAQVARTDATVLIRGESGTGKELVARALHDHSDRADGPFVPVNLGAMPETLLESELFGHERGAFSGAIRQRPGCFEQARGGTLFLDEVTEMPPKSQMDLLRVLETKQFNRVGGEQMMTSDVRIIAAANKSVEPLIAEGAFREDLYYRLNIVPIHLPPLRERREDIPLLAEHFLSQLCARHNRPPKRLAPEATQAMVTAPWPGNVRQLRNIMERLVITVPGETIEQRALPREIHPSDSSTAPPPRTLAEVVESAERCAITAALATANNHREKSAKLLDISVRTLHYKMSRYGIR